MATHLSDSGIRIHFLLWLRKTRNHDREIEKRMKFYLKINKINRKSKGRNNNKSKYTEDSKMQQNLSFRVSIKILKFLPKLKLIDLESKLKLSDFFYQN